MSDDLGTALHRFLDSERRGAEATAPDPRQESDALARRVGRIRAVRTGSTLLVAAAVVGLVTVGVQALGGPSLAPPALPSPTSTDEPAPSTTPTAPPTGTAAPTDGATPADPDPATFRSAEPMTPGALENSGDGWHLVLYGAESAESEVILPKALYLLSPDGRVQLVPTAIDPERVFLLDWLPGTTFALVSSIPEGQTMVVDLLTGAAGPVLGNRFDARFVGDGTPDVLFAADGKLRRVTAEGSLRTESTLFALTDGTIHDWTRSPDGSRVVLDDTNGPRVVSTSDLLMSIPLSPYPGRPTACRYWMWVGDSDLLLQCSAGGLAEALISPSEYWIAPADGGAPRPLTWVPDPPGAYGLWRVGDELITGAPEAKATWSRVTENGRTPLSAEGPTWVSVFDVRSAELLLMARERLPDGTISVSLAALDPVHGTSRVLVEGDPADGHWLEVAPQPYPQAAWTAAGDL